MPAITPSWVQTNPSLVLPEAIIQYQQASGAFETLPGSAPMTRLGEGDLYVYLKRFDIRTKVAAGQTAYNQLPSVMLNAEMASTPTYLIRVRAEYDHHDIAAAAQWQMSLPEAQRLGMRQATFQQLRSALLFGFQPANGEGLLNTQGATSVTLPADTYGNTSVVTYDNGQMAIFLLTQISAMKTRTMQLGMGQRITILGPQRVLGAMEYQNIVQLTSYQRAGAGTVPTAGVVKDVLGMNDDVIEWTYDDTLIGKGAGGTDAVILVMPEVKRPNGSRINTNEFAKLQPGLEATTLMLIDKAAPTEIPTPLPGGATDVLAELRSTSGWGVRPEAVTIISMQYS